MRYLAVIALPVLGAVGIQGLRDEPLAPRQVGALARRPAPSSGSACRCSRSRTRCASSCSRSGSPRRRGRCGTSPHATSLGCGRGAGACSCLELVVERDVLAAHRTGRHRAAQPGSRRAPEPHPAAAAPARRRRRRLRAPTAFVPRLAATRRPLPHVGSAGCLVPEGLPLHAARARLAGARDGTRHAVRRCTTRSATTRCSSAGTGTYLRVRTPLPVFYNACGDRRADAARRAPARRAVPRGADGHHAAASTAPSSTGRDGYDLVEVDGWQPRVSVVPNFRVVPSETGALRTDPAAVVRPRRARRAGARPGHRADPRRRARRGVLRRDLPRAACASTCRRAHPRSSSCARRSTTDGHATVDGGPATVVPVDGFLQGVAVPAGDHEVHLTYRDEAVHRRRASRRLGVGGARVRRRRRPGGGRSPATTGQSDADAR